MLKNDLKLDIVQDYTDRLIDEIRKKVVGEPRTYGFEYEFISDEPISLEDMGKLYEFMPKCEFKPDGDSFINELGIYITFEPGGQIEYHSPPLYAEDSHGFKRVLEIIIKTNSDIKANLGINYIATGYIPGREDVPLCLTSKRYKNLYKRLCLSGTRGREMMKGTASIHLHACILSNNDLPLLFSLLKDMSTSEEFKMQSERRDIWNNTDPCRCGLPYEGLNKNSDSREVIKEFVKVAMNADILDGNIPFYKTSNINFEAFLYHITTIFTDIRLNIKGPTLELRTLDSMPPSSFELVWKRFIDLVEAIS